MPETETATKPVVETTTQQVTKPATTSQESSNAQTQPVTGVLLNDGTNLGVLTTDGKVNEVVPLNGKMVDDWGNPCQGVLSIETDGSASLIGSHDCIMVENLFSLGGLQLGGVLLI